MGAEGVQNMYSDLAVTNKQYRISLVLYIIQYILFYISYTFKISGGLYIMLCLVHSHHTRKYVMLCSTGSTLEVKISHYVKF